ncbi:MAG TPA: UDP-glucose/GDP-mannose dehydrogenase family protein [Acidimicrobiales bacterium]|jgi:UDPglucose 6-dehydrogenase|nr:UDP-glucose/GDP-mannose dehydrogenase family protein [Acidimicrobiales bacterium]
MSPNNRDTGRNRRSVAVIGAGYVGLPTAATLAHFGHRVVLAEREPTRLAALRSGRMPIVEKDLDDLVAGGVAAGNLRFVESAVDAVAGAEFVFLCVPTPMSSDGSADLSYVEAAAKEIGTHLEPGTIVVNKSTVPVGSATMVEQVVGRPDIAVVSNPEFLREGTAVHDSLNPDRIVVGADDPQAAAKVGELFGSTGAPLIVTDATTSETIKYASNAFLATKLSFVNALAGLCEEVGADARDVLLGLGYDKRIGFEFLRPGPGWGGSCLPKDTRALLYTAREAGYDFSLLAGAIASNDEQLERVVSKVVAACGGSLDGVAVAVWGLTFKANTDDRRDSPSLDISHRLAGLGAAVQAFDPTVDADTDPDGGGPEDLRGLQLRGDPYDAATGARALVVLTEWDEFRWLDFARVLAVMAEPNIVDARNLLDPAAVRRMGFSYSGIGRR